MGLTESAGSVERTFHLKDLRQSQRLYIVLTMLLLSILHQTGLQRKTC
ncbi:Uncharacterised protein [Mycobacteroides abscessus subsp. abscessus]|nr:Uncharacterised protein [Mycobacteroides abscessus subsp. abscessus]